METPSYTGTSHFAARIPLLRTTGSAFSSRSVHRGATLLRHASAGGVNESALEAIANRKQQGQRGVFVGRTGEGSGRDGGGDRGKDGDRRRARDEWEVRPRAAGNACAEPCSASVLVRARHKHLRWAVSSTHVVLRRPVRSRRRRRSAAQTAGWRRR